MSCNRRDNDSHRQRTHDESGEFVAVTGSLVLSRIMGTLRRAGAGRSKIWLVKRGRSQPCSSCSHTDDLRFQANQRPPNQQPAGLCDRLSSCVSLTWSSNATQEAKIAQSRRMPPALLSTARQCGVRACLDHGTTVLSSISAEY